MKQVNITKEEQLKDYNTIANFLMTGNEQEVNIFVEHLNWKKFTIDCFEFMDIKFICKYKDYIDWEYITSATGISNIGNKLSKSEAGRIGGKKSSPKKKVKLIYNNESIIFDSKGEADSWLKEQGLSQSMIAKFKLNKKQYIVL